MTLELDDSKFLSDIRPSSNDTLNSKRPYNNETKHERFLRLAPQRVQKALDALTYVAKLSTFDNEYTECEANKIIVALHDRMNEVEQRLARKPVQKKMFSFD